MLGFFAEFFLELVDHTNRAFLGVPRLTEKRAPDRDEWPGARYLKVEAPETAGNDLGVEIDVDRGKPLPTPGLPVLRKL
jgi:hypothetical protein